MNAGAGSPQDFIADRDTQDTKCTPPQSSICPIHLPLECCSDPQSSTPAPGPHCAHGHAHLPCSPQLASGRTPPHPRFHSSLTRGLWVDEPLQWWGHHTGSESHPRGRMKKWRLSEAARPLVPCCFSTVLGSTSLLPACCPSNHRTGLEQPWALLLPLVRISCLRASHLGWSWKVTLWLTDFLVSQECSLGTRACGDHGHRLPCSTKR